MAISLLSSGKQITVKDNELEGVQNGDADTSYTVRQVDPERVRALRIRHTKPVFSRGGVREDKVDHDAFVDDMLDEILIGWSGVLDGGTDAACTREHKLMLDFPRKMALISLAGSNEVQKQAAKESSFRRLA